MKNRKSILLILLIAFIGCNKEDESLNLAPTTFSITTSVSNNSATITWSEATDPEGADITYTVKLDGQTIASGINATSYTFNDLEFSTVFVGEVIATDDCELTSEVSYSFETAIETQQNALNFDGIDDYVVLDGLAEELSTQNEITVEFLVKATIADNEDMIRPAMFAINPASPGQNKVLIVLGATDTEEQTGQLTIYEQGSPDKFLTSTMSIADGNCHHIAYNRTSNQVEAFLDGVSMGTFEVTVPLESTDRISLGQDWDMELSSDFFNGTIDELRIWKVTRSLEQIKESMNAELTNLSDDLIAYYNFNQGKSGENNTGFNMLYDIKNDKSEGELKNFLLNGTTSNFVGSNCVSR